MQVLVIEGFIEGSWRAAGEIEFREPEKGVAGATTLMFDSDFVFEVISHDELAAGIGPIDDRTPSVALPLTLDCYQLETWPGFFADHLPQGERRRALARDLGIEPGSPRADVNLVARTAGTPVGNYRVREAYERERMTLAARRIQPIEDRDIEQRSDALVELVQRIVPAQAPGSSGQGAWPKALLTKRCDDGLWYPDSMVDPSDAAEHIIVKLQRFDGGADATILAAEPPYLEIAREVGVRVARPLAYHRSGTLVIPRFDRVGVTSSGRKNPVLRGQESMLSALGIADGSRQHLYHEDICALLHAVASHPDDEVEEYVRRDFLNHVMGNPDNHGRNTALAKTRGGVALTPLFDFAPMRLADDPPSLGTRWRSLGNAFLDPDWRTVCSAAAGDDRADLRIRLRATLLELAVRCRELPTIAAAKGLDDIVALRAFRLDRVEEAVRMLEDWSGETAHG